MQGWKRFTALLIGWGDRNQVYRSTRGESSERIRYGPRLEEHVILKRDGDTLTIRPLGEPDTPPFEITR